MEHATKLITHPHYIPRECENSIAQTTPFYPILSVMGPRQAGKTKMIRKYFPHLPYFDFEQQEIRKEVLDNPEKFVRSHLDGAIFDEFHFVPQITEALKVVADEIIWEYSEHKKGSIHTRFVITSSHNYLNMGNVTETMVGRAGLIELLSMTAFELNANNVPSLLHKGGYPAIYTLGEEPEKFFRNYLKYYLEREIRLVHNIADFKKFQLFMKMCANRVGNLVNYDIMTSNLQVSRKVIDHWLSILELSYIIFMAPAYHNNFELTLTHQPKLYFYDTGLCAFLLGIEKEDDIPSHPMYGALFENLVFGDIRKKIMAANRSLETYFWHVPPKKQGAGGYEVDLIIVQGAKIKACEIKLSGTFDPHWLGRLNRFDEEKSKRLQECKKYIIYTGPTVQVEGGMAVNFKDVGILLGD